MLHGSQDAPSSLGRAPHTAGDAHNSAPVPGAVVGPAPPPPAPASEGGAAAGPAASPTAHAAGGARGAAAGPEPVAASPQPADSDADAGNTSALRVPTAQAATSSFEALVTHAPGEPSSVLPPVQALAAGAPLPAPMQSLAAGTPSPASAQGAEAQPAASPAGYAAGGDAGAAAGPEPAGMSPQQAEVQGTQAVSPALSDLSAGDPSPGAYER